MLKKISIKTRARTEMINIDSHVTDAIQNSGVREGVCLLWVPHTTAGVTINENADPDVVHDILDEMEKIVPFRDGYRHTEGNSAAHLKSSLFGPSLTLIIADGVPVLGTWQSVFFCEFDGPRTRRLVIKIMAD